MNYLSKSLLLFVFFTVATFSNAHSQCKAKELAKKWKADMPPYEYDSFVTDDFQYKNEKQVIDMEFTALAGLDYKLIFCTSMLPQPVGITIYNKPKTDPKRKIIYFDESGKDGFLCNFRCDKTGTYYIEYEVPVADQKNMNAKGCVLMLIGISEK